MRLSKAILIFTSSTLVTAKSTPGTKCRTNSDCNQNCLDGKWTIIPDYNDTSRSVFACDPLHADPVQYTTGSCHGRNLRDGGPKAAACEAVGGTNCKFRCVMSGTLSTKDVIEREWAAQCTKAKGTLPLTFTSEDEGLVRQKAGCDS
ncbi:hypothetical protein Q7P37_007182 [Cladosporium fusiforme]